MKDITECMEEFNDLWLDTLESKQILENNMQPGYLYPPNEGFMFVSGANVFREKMFRGRYACQAGDFGIYWTTEPGRVLGMASFNLRPNELFIEQIQGTRAIYLSSDEKRAIKILPWEQALINVVEDLASPNFDFVSVVSSQEIRIRRPNIKNKNLERRYDIPAIYRNMFPSADGYYRKQLAVPLLKVV